MTLAPLSSLGRLLQLPKYSAFEPTSLCNQPKGGTCSSPPPPRMHPDHSTKLPSRPLNQIAIPDRSTKYHQQIAIPTKRRNPPHPGPHPPTPLTTPAPQRASNNPCKKS